MGAIKFHCLEKVLPRSQILAFVFKLSSEVLIERATQVYLHLHTISATAQALSLDLLTIAVVMP